MLKGLCDSILSWLFHKLGRTQRSLQAHLGRIIYRKAKAFPIVLLWALGSMQFRYWATPSGDQQLQLTLRLEITPRQGQGT